VISGARGTAGEDGGRMGHRNQRRTDSRYGAFQAATIQGSAAVRQDLSEIRLGQIRPGEIR